MRLPSLFTALFGVGLLLATPSEDEQVKRVVHNLMCTCGCPHLIGQCGGGEQCSVAPQLTQEITQLVVSGKTDEEIYALFESRYGQSVRAVPRAEGFNLLAWAFPFLGLFCGLLIVVVMVRHLKPEAAGVSSGKSAPAIDEEYRRMIDAELRK